MGNVKPLISEDADFEKYVTPTIDMVDVVRVIGGNEKSIPFKVKLINNEYVITLSSGSFSSRETVYSEIKLKSSSGKTFLIPSLGISLNNGEKDKKAVVNRRTYTTEGSNTTVDSFGVSFTVPRNQDELNSELPFKRSLDIQCLNVKGGIIKFTFVMSSDSTII